MRRDHAGLVRDVVFKFCAKVFQHAAHRHGSCIAQGLLENLMYTGFQGEIWLEPGKEPTQGKLYRDKAAGHFEPGKVALVLGAIQMASPKGTLPHRLIGWIWVGLMMLLAGTSIFIKVIFPGHFSYIHLLTAWVLLITPLAVMAVRMLG